MAEYVQESPAVHLTLDELNNLIELITDGIDTDAGFRSGVDIQVTEGNLTKSYESVAEMEEDPTLPKDVRDVSIHIGGKNSTVRISFDSSDWFSYSRIKISGEEEFVRAKNSEINEFLKMHRIVWRDYIDGYFSILFTSLILGGLFGLVSSTFAPELNTAIGVISYLIIFSFLYLGLDYFYPKYMITKDVESVRVKSIKKLTKMLVTALTIVGSVVAILEYINV